MSFLQEHVETSQMLDTKKILHDCLLVHSHIPQKDKSAADDVDFDRDKVDDEKDCHLGIAQIGGSLHIDMPKLIRTLF